MAHQHLLPQFSRHAQRLARLVPGERLEQRTALAVSSGDVSAVSPVVISGYLADPQGEDGGYEYIQLLATRTIDFAITPVAIVACNNRAPAQGWVTSRPVTFAFTISQGVAAAGEVFYVGGDEKTLAGPRSTSIAQARWLATATGDDAPRLGFLGHDAPNNNADGIAVFLGDASTLTEGSVPVDAVFYGHDIGDATPADRAQGYTLPRNDLYSGGVFGFDGQSRLFPNPRVNEFTRLVGTYDAFTGAWASSRFAVPVPLAGKTLADIESRIDFTPPRVSLVSDTGFTSTDRVTSDGRFAVGSLPGTTVRYARSSSGPWTDWFAPAEGFNAVYVQHANAAGGFGTPTALAFTLDTTRPTITFESDRNTLTDGQTADITLTLSESVVGLDLSDITLTEAAGTLSPLTPVPGRPRTFRTTLSPAAWYAGPATLAIPYGRVEDVAGNGNEASAALTLTVDTIRPTVAIAVSQPLISSAASAMITFTVSEQVTGFTRDDVVVTGGTLAEFTGSGASYSAVFTPDADFDGPAHVRVREQAFVNASGNTNAFDFSLSPAVQVRRHAPFGNSLTSSTAVLTRNASTTMVRFGFNTPVFDFTAADVLVTPGTGTISTPVRDGATNTYVATFTAAAGFLGVATISVPSDVCADADGIRNVGTGLELVLQIDTTVPEITLIAFSRGGVSVDALKAHEDALVTFVLNKAVFGFSIGDVIVHGGRLRNFAGSGTTYTATFVPNINSTAPGTISVPAGRFVDQQGNANLMRIGPTILINTVVPTMTISQRLPVLKGGQSTTVTFQIRGTVNTAGPNPAPFELSDISLAPNQGSIFGLTSLGVARGVHTYTAVYTTPSGCFAGPMTLSVPANAFRVVGNDVNGNAAASLRINVDAQGPATVISTTAPALKIGQTVVVEFTIANETANVVGFEAADVSLSSGTISAPTRLPGTNAYRATYTPATNFEGPVTISLAAGKFTDAAGNPNTLADSITLSVDTKAPNAPDVSLVSDTGSSLTDKITSDARLQATGTEAGATLQYWTSSAMTTAWTPALATQGTNTVYVTQTDTAGNPSTATAFAFEYRSTGPALTAIQLPAASTGLAAGRFVELKVTFARPVFVTGDMISRPIIQIGGFTTGDATRRAVYASGSGTATLVFRYQVQTGDKAVNGISYPSSLIVLEGATICDAADNAASLVFTLPSRRPVTRINA